MLEFSVICVSTIEASSVFATAIVNFLRERGDREQQETP